TPYDRILATSLGSYAAAMVADGHFDRMVVLRENRLSSVSLSAVANKVRTVPPNAPAILSALAVGTSFGVSSFEQRFVGTEVSAVLS
ncbi:MAG: 6-phosphofructokinase, partial [Bacteroidota bacterium]